LQGTPAAVPGLICWGFHVVSEKRLEKIGLPIVNVALAAQLANWTETLN
jgi:hypothetical protein